MVSIGASVQNQISERMEERIPELNSSVFQFVNLAQPSKGFEDWIGVSAVWNEASSRLATAGVLDTEVQIVWLQNDTVSNASTAYPERPLAIKDDILTLIDIIKGRFTNLKHIFLNARPYSWSIEENHAEPKGYLNGYACKWIVEDQIAGRIPALPWICDDGYLWTDADNIRSDGFQALSTDFQSEDVHLNSAGKTKFGNWLFDFFKNHIVSKRYFN